VKKSRRILYATDYSKASGPALQQAVDLAKQNNAELLVVHVIEPVISGELTVMEPTYSDDIAYLRSLARFSSERRSGRFLLG
jgi:nucleotide-binding universal stress UspA family protein